MAAIYGLTDYVLWRPNRDLGLDFRPTGEHDPGRRKIQAAIIGPQIEMPLRIAPIPTGLRDWFDLGGSKERFTATIFDAADAREVL
jgi:hypothetical protein